MPSASPSPKRARLSGTEAGRNSLHNLYQVIYNLNVGKSEISRYVFHSFLNENGDWLKIRLYALVESEGEEDKKAREKVTRWKGYVRLSDIEKTCSTSTLASNISAGEMHISGDQSRALQKDSGGLTLHLNHNSNSPIIVKLTNSSDPAESSLMDICCASITNLHAKSPAQPIVNPVTASSASKHTPDDIQALRKENERLQHDLRETNRQLAAAKGGYEAIDPKIVNQVPKGTSKLQPSVKQAKKAERGFADDDEW